MKIQLNNTALPKVTADCIVTIVWDKKLSASASEVDERTKGALARFVKEATSFDGVGGMAFFSLRREELAAKQLLLLNLGDKKALHAESFKKAIEKVAQVVEAQRYQDVCFAFDDVVLKDAALHQVISLTAIAMQQATYRFEHYKTKPKTSALKNISFLMSAVKDKALSAVVREASAIVHGMNFTMDLANCPPNFCHTEYLAKEARALAKQYSSLHTTIIDAKALQKMGAGAILAVGQGSRHTPKFVIVEHRGAAKSQAPIALVGKGITFDTGGNNLKSFDGMLGMKYDMSGAASVLGVIKAVAELKLKINLVGILAVAENMPGPDAYRPEDVIKSLSGQTIEVLNTDAEGRLVLCDALTYIERYKPKAVIDIATLTGAIITCLGDIHTGLFSNHDTLAAELENAAKRSLDGVWRLPIGEAYDAMLNSTVADIKNIGGPAAGSVTAACFLARFTKQYAWAHLDIAGTASVKGGLNRKATGRPVPLLMEYLLRQ